jgi:hypothetical protein
VRTKTAISYLVVALAMMLTPLAGLLWYQPDPEAQTAELAEWPAALDRNGVVNIEFLPQAGNYFDDHFAYRDELITLHAQVQTGLLGVSPTDQVIYGSDGWLYYGGTLDDFLGSADVSERARYNGAHNLHLMQEYVQARGARFAVVVAPNKNSVYPEHMPWWYLPGNDDEPAALAQAFADAGVNYIDLFDLFGGAESNAANSTTPAQYFSRDSHWNNRGALAAYERIMAELGRTHLELDINQSTQRVDHKGDLDVLLFPTAVQPEANDYFSLPSFAYSSTDKTVEASSSATVNPQGIGTLLMYRDSFADALIPLFSSTFHKAYYSKLLPWDLGDVERYGPDVVLVESAQRSTLNFSANPPAMPGPVVEADRYANAPVRDTATTLNFALDGPYLVASGILDEAVGSGHVRVFVRIDGTQVREAYLTTTRSLANRQNPAAQATGTSGQAPSATTDLGYKIFLPNSDGQLNGRELDVIIESKEGTYVIRTDIFDGDGQYE